MVREFAIRHFCGGFLDEKLTGLLNGDKAKGGGGGGGRWSTGCFRSM